MTTMGTQSNWGYAEFQAKTAGRTAHKIPLVSPRIDVDVTGYSLKNVGTHLIDHPRDEGLKHREQLWNFQQKYRGAAIHKFRNGAACDGEEKKSNPVSSDESPEEEVNIRPNLSTTRSNMSDNSSLPSRFKKRLKQRSVQISGLRSGDFVYEPSRRKSGAPKEAKDEDSQNLRIQRLYSSALIVKNTIYNQLREGEDKKSDETNSEKSKIHESFNKFGPSLEKLPDIQYPGSRTLQQLQQIRFCRSINNYNSCRVISQLLDRRTFALRRTFTNMSDLGPSKIKLRLVERRREECAYNDANGSVENNDGDENYRYEEDEDDECDNDVGVDHEETMHAPDCEQKHPEHVDIRNNITHVDTPGDLEFLDRKEHQIRDVDMLRSEQTFHVEPRTKIHHERNKYARTDLGRRSKSELSDKSIEKSKCSQKVRESWNSTKTGSRENLDKDRPKPKRSQKKTIEETIKDDDSDTDESLDIPEDRFGPTTHSIDKKLSIRKPWEWRPSPYRWTDKAYVKESDKPYIERIINRGEIIDEYNYDSFARTRPLKLHNYPEGAGYKDRNGVLR